LTDASAVDMESLIAGSFAREYNIPFAILRSIADPAERTLPPLAMKAMTADGGINVPGIIRELTRAPRQLASLRSLAADSRAAFKTLKRCGLLPGLFLGLGTADV
jgi:adenosylhomocysteine nucleosidase